MISAASGCAKRSRETASDSAMADYSTLEQNRPHGAALGFQPAQRGGAFRIFRQRVGHLVRQFAELLAQVVRQVPVGEKPQQLVHECSKKSDRWLVRQWVEVLGSSRIWRLQIRQRNSKTAEVKPAIC